MKGRNFAKRDCKSEKDLLQTLCNCAIYSHLLAVGIWHCQLLGGDC